MLHYRKFVEIDDLWDDLEEGGMNIRIQRIQRRDNRDAERLANLVLDEEEPGDSQVMGGCRPFLY